VVSAADPLRLLISSENYNKIGNNRDNWKIILELSNVKMRKGYSFLRIKQNCGFF
jgi:hypothetical protein